MSKKCLEHECTAPATKSLVVDLTDRSEIYWLCDIHHSEALKAMSEMQARINNASRDELIGRLREIYTPEEFEKAMKEVGEGIERWYN